MLKTLNIKIYTITTFLSSDTVKGNEKKEIIFIVLTLCYFRYKLKSFKLVSKHCRVLDTHVHTEYSHVNYVKLL